MSFFRPQNRKEFLFKIFAGVFLLVSLGVFFQQRLTEVSISERNDEAVLTVFAREKCSHCRDEKEFLSKWQQENPELKTQILDIENDSAASEMFVEITDELQLSKSTPVTVLGNQVFVGFDTATSMGERFRKYYEENSPLPSFAEVWPHRESLEVFSFRAEVCEEGQEECAVEGIMVPIPFWGEVDISTLQSPTILSLLLGLIDGFNPCAMWVLVMFLLALIQIGDRFKMFVTAGLFLLAEAVMYGLILTVWFTTWNFVGLEKWITPLVGTIALASGFFFLNEGFFSEGTCKVTSTEQRKKISRKIREISESPLTLLTILAILALAFSVNIIEFACSFGIPQTFTQILHLSHVTVLAKLWYIVLYIIAYMFDDFIVFGIALYSIEKIGVTHKYARASNLIGGFLMLLLGLLLMFAPEVLAFR